jgi:hypothetical protein
VGKVVLFLFLASGSLWAQSTAQINGTVKDQTGAVLPGAEVTATQTATGAKRQAVTDETGSYTLANLPIGPYMLEVALPGFRTYVQTGIVLQVDSNPTIPVILQVGQVSEQIEVAADAALVETHSTGIGTVVDNQRVLELPLNGRNATELIFLAGMATAGSGSGSINSVRNYPTVIVSVAGGLGGQTTFLLDGANHNDAHNNLNLPLPFPDALQEFKVETSALPAQYGIHGAATVNAVTKSGTNAFHGDLFEFVRNGVFNSRNVFADKRDTLKRNQFGGTVGGPVQKDKLFFFAGYQGTIQKSDPPQSIAYVPTPAMLAGDFTAVASPDCNNSRQIVLQASQGFDNNRISPTRFNPVALKVASLLPTTADPCGKVTYGLISNQDEHIGVGRIDYQKSLKNSIFGRFSTADLDVSSTYDGKNPITINTAGAHYRVYSLALGDTYLIGNGMVSAFRVSANRTKIPKVADKFTSWSALGSNVSALDPNQAQMTVMGNGFAIGGGNSVTTTNATGPIPQVSEDFSWIKGAHQLGFGGTYIYNTANFLTTFRAPGAFQFNGNITNMPLADFLLGAASGFNQGNIATWFNRYHYFGFYAQDTWKIRPRLSVSYGLRFEPYFAPSSKFNGYVHFDPQLFAQNVHSTVFVNGPAGLIVPGDPQYTPGNAPEGSKVNRFVPRVGFVWDPKGDGRMTMRAAYGLFTDRQYIQSYTAFGTNPPYGNNITLANVNMSNPWANYPGGNPLPVAVNKNMTFPAFGSYVSHPFDFHPTYMNQWNLSIQRQIGTDWLLTANYLGNNIIHLVSGRQLNPAIYFPGAPVNGVCMAQGYILQTTGAACSTTTNTNQRRLLNVQNPSQGQYYSGVSELDDGGTGTYNGMFLSVQRRLSHGISALANYTWSHCISDVFEPQLGIANAVNIPGDRKKFRSNCATSDVRHVFNLSAVVETPGFANRSLRAVAGGWQFSPILKIRSAAFFSVTTGIDNAFSGQGTQIPNLVPGINPYATDKNADHWLNPLAFASPATGTYGTLGLNALKGPGTFQLDMSVTRSFKVAETKSIQLRGEAFNLPNHPNLNPPVSTMNSGAFGKIQSALDPRIMQLALKLLF